MWHSISSFYYIYVLWDQWCYDIYSQTFLEVATNCQNSYTEIYKTIILDPTTFLQLYIHIPNVPFRFLSAYPWGLQDVAAPGAYWGQIQFTWWP